MRYASTGAAAAPPPAPAATAPATPAAEPSFPNLDTITLDNLNASVAGGNVAPGQIGYLHDIGLDYGWGPTSTIQWLLEHVHVYTGMPWWGSLIVTAVSLRLAMFPLFLKSADSQARSAAIVSVTKPYTDRMTAAQKEGNQAEMMLCWQEVRRIRKEAGVSMVSQLGPVALQGVVGYCGFKLTKAMATLPVPAFRDGGLLWLSDLTIPDGYLILPGIMALTMHAVIRMGGETGSATLPPMMKNVMLYVMPAFMVIFLAWQPAATTLWFTGTGLVGILQSQILQRPKIREYFGIAPIMGAQAGAGSTSPMSDLEGAFAKRFSALNEARKAAAASSSAAAKSNSPSGPASSPASSSPFGRGISYTPPTQQMPKLNTRPSPRVLDTTLVHHHDPDTAPADRQHDDMIQVAKPAPTAGSGSVFSQATDAFRSFKGTMSRATKQTPEQAAEAEKEAFRRRAAEYERAAQSRRQVKTTNRSRPGR